MHPLAAKTAAFSGWLLARYSLWSIRPDRVTTPGIEGWPTPAIDRRGRAGLSHCGSIFSDRPAPLEWI